MNGTRKPVSLTASSVAVKVTEFWSNVTIGAPDECWPWTSYDEDGYGKFYFDGEMRGAHELAVTFTTGERRDPSLDTCHSCNNPPCCNPGHLRFDTRSSNVQDMLTAGTHYANPGKLSTGDVATIRIRLASGARQQDLADQYEVSNSLISMIKTGRRHAA